MPTTSPSAQPVGRMARAAQRLVLATARPPLARLWAPLYRLAARGAAATLARGLPGTAVYARGSLGSPELVPGLSDVDLVLVTAPTADLAAAARLVHGRWERARRLLPLVTHLVDRPRVVDERELAALEGRSAYTFGLGATRVDAASGAVAGPALLDRNRALERPGVPAGASAWRRLSGPERRASSAPLDGQQVRIAVWLELVYFWKRAFGALADPSPPHTASLCVKLVAEPTTALLWLAGADLPDTRRAALDRARALVPGHDDALDRIAATRETLHRRPAPPVDDAVRVLAALTQAAVVELDRQLAGRPTTAVRLVSAGPGETLPLCDWPTVVLPGKPEARFTVADGFDRPDRLRAAIAAAAKHRFTALRCEGVLAFPSATRSDSAMRAVACRATDPVSFALLDGPPDARFAAVPGWSADDWARRAVAEHRHALGLRSAGVRDLLGAARAAHLSASLADGAPALAVDLDAVVELLRDAGTATTALADAVREALAAERGGVRPDARTREALERVVRSLPPYRA